jgi:hypothetical protein
VLHDALWAAHPLLQLTSDMHKTGPALQKSAFSTVLAAGASATVAHQGEPAAMAVREGAEGQLALGSSRHQ